jgi:hypothetical protein
MADDRPQDYASHRRFVPLFHFVAFGLVVLNLLWSAYVVIARFSLDALLSFGLAVALVLLFWYTRTFALTNQDRLIRLEERLRLERLLPADLKPRIGELRTSQLIGLRFASDGEVAELVRWTLDEGAGCEAIKKRVRTWRPDHLRV